VDGEEGIIRKCCFNLKKEGVALLGSLDESNGYYNVTAVTAGFLQLQ